MIQLNILNLLNYQVHPGLLVHIGRPPTHGHRLSCLSDILGQLGLLRQWDQHELYDQQNLVFRGTR